MQSLWMTVSQINRYFTHFNLFLSLDIHSTTFLKSFESNLVDCCYGFYHLIRWIWFSAKFLGTLKLSEHFLVLILFQAICLVWCCHCCRFSSCIFFVLRNNNINVSVLKSAMTTWRTFNFEWNSVICAEAYKVNYEC